MVAATSFAANHVSARIAFDHGASVAAGVRDARDRYRAGAAVADEACRVSSSPCRARCCRVSPVAGVLVAVQSYCLYSAVALIPAGAGAARVPDFARCCTCCCPGRSARRSRTPRRSRRCCSRSRAWRSSSTSARTSSRRAGARSAPACAGRSLAAVSFAFVYYLNANALKALDGRLRTFVHDRGDGGRGARRRRRRGRAGAAARRAPAGSASRCSPCSTASR